MKNTIFCAPPLTGEGVVVFGSDCKQTSTHRWTKITCNPTGFKLFSCTYYSDSTCTKTMFASGHSSFGVYDFCEVSESCITNPCSQSSGKNAISGAKFIRTVYPGVKDCSGNGVLDKEMPLDTCFVGDGTGIKCANPERGRNGKIGTTSDSGRVLPAMIVMALGVVSTTI